MRQIFYLVLRLELGNQLSEVCFWVLVIRRQWDVSICLRKLGARRGRLLACSIGMLGTEYLHMTRRKHRILKATRNWFERR